ncbi:MAG: Ig-like domain-containing protein [Mycobacteriaceae bacterium]
MSMYRSAGKSGAALGAAAFALGLSLAGPQLGVASAAPADAGSAGSSAQAESGATADAPQSANRGKASRGSVSKRTAPAVPGPAATTPTSVTPTLTPIVAQGGSDSGPVVRTAAQAAERRAGRPALATPANISAGVAAREIVPIETPGVETPTAAIPVVTTNPATGPAEPGPVARAPSPAAALPAPAAATVLTSGPAASASAAANFLTSGSTSPSGDFLSGALLMIRRTFANQAPSGSFKQAMVRPSGQVWGFVAGSDPDGDPITYALKKAPKYGSVTIDEHGVYTYTPGANFTGTDSFTATVSDGAFHVNLLSLLNGGKTVVKVAVNSNVADPAGTVADTFSGSAGSQPNSALWTISTGAYIDSGVQTYTASTDNVRLDGQGHLVLQAQNPAGGYTSGEVITQGKLDTTYGTTTARIKFPSGQGIWPAFWMLGSTYSHDTWNALGPTGWPGAGEIDMMELVNTGTTYHVALHGPRASDGADYYAGTGQFVGATGSIGDLTAAYHDYWVIRAPNLVVVGVDDTKLATFTPDSLPAGGTWVFNQPMYTTLNLAVGGAWPGPPDSTTPWPSTMLVDSFKYTPLA